MDCVTGLEKLYVYAIMKSEVEIMKKYLIACDIDGTTLNRDGQLTQKTIKTLRKYQDMGHLIVLSTGRPIGATIPIYEQIGLKTPIITDNGASIDHPHDIDFARMRTFIPKDIVDRLFIFTKPYLDSAFFSNETTLFSYQYNAELEKYFIPVPNLKFVEGDFTSFDVEPSGMIFTIKTSFESNLETFIKTNFKHTLSYRLWGSKNGLSIYEIYNKHTSKSSALTYLLNYYEIPKEQHIAFGDGLNDIEMLRDAKYGIAMKNGVRELKAVADDITHVTNNEDGMVKYIEYFFEKLA